MKYTIILLLFILFSCTSNELIDGYTDKISYYNDENIDIYLNSKYNGKSHLKIYDIYNNEVHSFHTKLFAQDTINKPWENGFGYKKSCTIKLPKLKSGVYLIENKIPFIIKSSDTKPITLLYHSNTVNAYNNAGGKSLYYSFIEKNKAEDSDKRAKIVSFQRPYNFENEHFSFDFIKILYEKYGDNINFICDQDMENYNNINKTKVLIIAGHSEYWTRNARINFDKFVDNGGNAAIFSGNTMWWQVRYNDKFDKMICYKDINKETLSDSTLFTINWYQDIIKYPIEKSIGANFNFGGYGNKEDNGFDGYKIIDQNSPLFEGTLLKNNDIITILTDEYDGVPLIIKDKNPMVDTTKIKFYKINLLAYDKGFRSKETFGTFIAFQKKSNSGKIVNTGTTNWCSEKTLNDKSGIHIKKITYNIIDKLLYNKNIFSN